MTPHAADSIRRLWLGDPRPSMPTGGLKPAEQGPPPHVANRGHDRRPHWAPMPRFHGCALPRSWSRGVDLHPHWTARTAPSADSDVVPTPAHIAARTSGKTCADCPAEIVWRATRCPDCAAAHERRAQQARQDAAKRQRRAG